ncbi:hypothetical protein sos41_11990 [Alphaproteobacteria bacterium SO-S41]|nr:hypothetical protein sos41_11990 [Alphaproteobacteria bacterium SO-S41]
MSFRNTWIADVLRAAGLPVVEEAGWKSAGRAEIRGPFQGVILHHTAGPAAPKGGETPSLNVIKNGRPGLNGPLSQCYLSRKGVWHVVAAGRTNHAGPGKFDGLTDGNDDFIGAEMENAGDGKDPWPDVQLRSAVKGTAALLHYLKQPARRAIGHKEWATPHGRKIDPSFEMEPFRVEVGAAIAALGG